MQIVLLHNSGETLDCPVTLYTRTLKGRIVCAESRSLCSNIITCHAGPLPGLPAIRSLELRWPHC